MIEITGNSIISNTIKMQGVCVFSEL